MIRLLLWLSVALAVSGQAHAQSAGLLPCNAASLSVSSVSSNVQLSKCAPTAIIMNIGSQEAFYALGGTSGAVATTSNYSIPGNSFQQIVVGTNGEWLAAITSTSTTTLRVVQGTGL